MSSHRLAKFFLSRPFRLIPGPSSGRRTAPYRLSGSRAATPFASTASTERSMGMVSLAAAGGLGLGFGLGGGFFAPGAALLVSGAGLRGEGASSVGAGENSSAAPAPTCHAVRSESLRVTP